MIILLWRGVLESRPEGAQTRRLHQAGHLTQGSTMDSISRNSRFSRFRGNPPDEDGEGDAGDV